MREGYKCKGLHFFDLCEVYNALSRKNRVKSVIFPKLVLFFCHLSAIISCMRLIDGKLKSITASRVQRKSLYKMPMSHSHAYYEIYYLESGTCTFFTKNNALNLTTGDFVIIPPKISHCVYYSTTCTRVNIYYEFEDLCDQGRPFHEGIQEISSVASAHIPAQYQASVGSLIDQLINEGRMEDTCSAQMSCYLLRLFFLTILRCGIPVGDEKKKGGDTVVSDALSYITSHPAADLTLQTLAEKAGLSESYFSKKFKSETGVGLKEFITLTRLKEAEKELLATDHRIEEIASNNGFMSGNYFKDCFKKSYGVSPREYRKQHADDQKLLLSMKNDGI